MGRTRAPWPALGLPWCIATWPAAAISAWIVLAIAVGPAPARAQAVEAGRLVLDAGQVWAYAESLLRDGEYYRAISEYKRLAHFFPESPEARTAQLRIGLAYLLGSEPAQAIDHFTGLLEQPAWSDRQPRLHFLRAVARLELEREAPYSLREPAIALALDELRGIPRSWPGAAAAQGFVLSVEHPQDLRSKSPWLAGGLSAVVPGAGSIYVGNYAEGALAFFFSTLLITSSAKAFDRNNDGLGVVLGAGALALYGGSIYAAANGAHRFNDAERSRHLAEQRVRFGLALDAQGVAGLLETRF